MMHDIDMTGPVDPCTFVRFSMESSMACCTSKLLVRLLKFMLRVRWLLSKPDR